MMMIAFVLDGWIAAFPKSGTGPLSGQNKQHQFVNLYNWPAISFTANNKLEELQLISCTKESRLLLMMIEEEELDFVFLYLRYSIYMNCYCQKHRRSEFIKHFRL